MKLRISAAVRMPPIGLRLRLSLPDKRPVSTSSSSRSAAGWMPSSVAIRSSTSLRSRSLKQETISDAWSRSRWTRMVAMICGCSFLINSATADESIHFRPSIPLVSLPCRIRSMIAPALSSPSALVSTERMYSLESRDRAVCCSASRTNSCSTSFARHVLQRGHRDPDLLDLARAEKLEYLRGFFLTDRHQQERTFHHAFSAHRTPSS
jgi:hypothetical protein